MWKKGKEEESCSAGVFSAKSFKRISSFFPGKRKEWLNDEIITQVVSKKIHTKHTYHGHNNTCWSIYLQGF
jgi:hypothetical protein